MASLNATDTRMKGSVRREYRREIDSALLDLDTALFVLDNLIRDMREDHPRDSEAPRSYLALGRARLHDALDSFQAARRELR